MRSSYLVRVLVLTSLLLGGTHVAADAITPDPAQAAPGLSFRYMQTFGEPGVAYLTDSDHFVFPEGVAVDSAGNLWVAETMGGRVLKYGSDGAFLMTIGSAGSPKVDQNNFCEPSDVAVDGAGNVWVADRCAARVAQYASDGTFIKELGVMWETGNDNAHFSNPAGLALDSAGNLYVGDEWNHRVQVFDNSGAYLATIGETGVPGTTNDRFQNAFRLAIDADDNLYVVDRLNHRVQIFNSSHDYVATIGTTGEAGSDNNHLNEPNGIAVDATRIYVADNYNNRVQVFDRATRAYVATVGAGWGSGDDQFNLARDVAVDASGNLYVADSENHRVQKFNNSLEYVRTFGTTGVAYLLDNEHFNRPVDLAVDAAGNIVFVEGTGAARLLKMDAGGAVQFAIGAAGMRNADNGVAVDASGRIYIAKMSEEKILVFNSSGVLESTIGTTNGTGDYQFNGPDDVEVDQNGNIYVSDKWNHRVMIYDSSGAFVTQIGVTAETGSDNNHFDQVQGVAVDADGNIYVVDTMNHRVQKYNSNRVWQMTFGITGECGDNFAHLCAPSGVDVDAAGNVYIADTSNLRIQVFSASGKYLTTIGGSWNYGQQTNCFINPYGVAVDQEGNVYVADTLNFRIQKFAPGVPGWQQANINGFGENLTVGVTVFEVFKGKLYAGSANMGSGGQVWHLEPGTSWVAASQPNFGGDPMGSAVIDLEVFNDRLYAGLGWYDSPVGQAWRSADGKTWQPVTTDGFGDGQNNGVTNFIAFNGMLYAGTSNTAGEAQVWRSSTGNPGSWAKVKAATSGAANVTAFAVFKDALYAAIESPWDSSQPAQVWRTTDGSNWTTLVDDGFGVAGASYTGGFAEFKGCLYVGTNGEAGAQLLRTCNGTSFELAKGEGFGDANNNKVDMVFANGNALYAGLNNYETGLEVWRTSDGATWEQVTLDGFGDSNNNATLWSHAVTMHQGSLYLGTWNWASGGEVWVTERHQAYLPVALNRAAYEP